MITCSLMGGLGNQLFQIFATIAYALENKTSFVFFYTDILGGDEGTKRNTYWNNFLSSLKKFTSESVSITCMYREEGFNYSKLKPYSDDLMLSGYFQSHKYFEEYYDPICKLIKLQDIKAKIMSEYSHNYNEIVSMHFRLGDYKTLQDYHIILDYEYYEKALGFLLNKSLPHQGSNQERHILYFCEKQDNEDVENTINKLKIKFPTCVFEKANDEIEDWKQMIIRSCCKDNIIANSTFSWWGAYFNDNTDKNICYPSQWFGYKNSHLVTADLFPETWNKI